MNKQQKILLAGCVAIAGLCFAQEPETYAVIDLTAGSEALSYPVTYLDDVPAGGWTAAHKTTALVLRKIPAGTFTMGSPTNEAGRAESGEEQHPVSFSKPYYIGVFEVTQGQWERIIGTPVTTDADRPITDVSYAQMEYLANTLNQKASLLINLPTEAQWEYACRAGTATAYNTGSDDAALLTNVAWYATNNVPPGAKAVGGKLPNAWGLYDAHGNVEEACLEEGSESYLRGGYYSRGAYDCRSAVRKIFNAQLPSVGLRLYMNPDPTYLLTVNGGTGSGSYSNNVSVTVTATPVEHFTFAKWLVEPANAVLGAGFAATAASTTVLMPYYDVTLTASNTPVQYTLTVENGQGGGYYTNGQVVAITATPTNDFFRFDQWTGDTDTVADRFAASTVVTIPGTGVVVTATYRSNSGVLTVNNGTGSGTYTNGQVVAISANPTNALYVFDRWEGNVATVADVTNAQTTVTVPDSDLTVTATYRDTTFPLTVNFATGSGAYTNGQLVTIGESTTPPSAGHEFSYWAGDTAGVANVSNAPTTFTMPLGPATLTAVFRSIAVPQKTYLVVPLAGGAETYLDAPPPGGWTDTHKTAQLVLRKVPAGSFTMGSPAGETGRQDDEVQHTVTQTKDFYLGVFELTQAQWQQVAGSNPSSFAGNTLPVEQLSYEMIRGTTAEANWPTTAAPAAGSFMKTLQGRPGLATADLPTEAQWEYACRAGTTGAYAGDLDAMAWYDANNAPNGTKAVGSKMPNAWGLYDMHGNVYEICLDWYFGNLGTAAVTDPLGPEGVAPGGAPMRVMRGGAYNYDAAHARSAYRGNLAVTNYVAGNGLSVSNRYPWVGLRVAVSQTTASALLNVVNGTVNTGGYFTVGTAIGLSPAEAPAGMKFGAWQVAPAGTGLGTGFVATEAQTLLTMPAADVTVTAVYMPEAATGIFLFTQNNAGVAVELWATDGYTFPIIAPAPAAGYRFNVWTVEPAGANLGAGFNPASAMTTVVMPAHNVTVTPGYVLDLPDDPETPPTVGVLFTYDAGEGQRPARFSARGLPSGLRIDRTTGVISGTPTRSGDFTVEITARYEDGTAVPYTIAMPVQALAAAAQGTFTGYLYPAETTGLLNISGIFTLKVSTQGKLTAKITTQTDSLSFSKSAWTEVTATGLYRATLTTRQGEELVLSVDGTNGTLAATLSGGRVGTRVFTLTGQKNAFAERNDSAAQGRLSAYKGYYTVALPIEACETTAETDNEQSGSGYLTVSIRDRGVVKIAGMLADGTRVSASSTLLTDEAGGSVPLFVRLYSRRGLLAGLLRFTGSTTPTSMRVDESADVRLEWVYPGRSFTLTGDAFDARLSAFGAFFDTLTDLQVNYTGARFRAEGFAWSLPLIPGSMGSLTIASGPENPDVVKMKATKRSGLFTGSFKTEVEGRMMTLKHMGVMTRNGDAYVGEGAYVWKRTVNGYTLKSSYRVWIEAE